MKPLPATAAEDVHLAVFEALGDGVAVVGADGAVVAANAAACALLGVAAPALVGARFAALGFALLHADGSAIAAAEHPLARVRNGSPAAAERVYLLRRPDATQQALRLAVRPLHAGQTAPRACVLVLADAAAPHDALLRQASELANRTKSEFLSRVSHEMRTPLNAVIGFTQLLRLSPEGLGPAQVERYTEHVLRASQQLLALINDLLDLQRVDEGRLALQREPLAVRALVDAAFALLQPLAGEHGVALRNEVDDGAWVAADAQRTRQVLFNIVSNAVKYNRSAGWVCIRMAADADAAGRAVIEVQDTGAGLAEGEVLRLFQPFERLGQESGEIEGAGLGLVIARRLVEAMDGELGLASAAGTGTMVRIALPRAEAPPAEAAAAADAPALRMLYVEDNRINAILFEEAMRLHGGIELRVAEDGAEALSVAADWPPQVLVLDANLPDMSGYDVLSRLRALPATAGVPAFMCSADAQDVDLQRARAAGCIGYWTKPIDVGQVMADLKALHRP